MNTAKRKRLEKAGWKVGTAQEFLNLSAEEAAYVEVKLNLAKVLSNRRKSLRLTQLAVAKRDQIEPVTRCEDGGWRPISFD